MLRSLQSALRCCDRYDSSHKTSRLLTLRSLLLASGALGYSALVPALGLGEITLHSALTQPLDAEIALLEPGELSEGELSVSLATAEEFSRAGVERVFFLNDLRFTAILQGNRSVIRVVSNKPVTEPFLNFLVQVNQPGGRSLREYTVLIDPPGSPGIEPRSKPGSNLVPVSPANSQSSAPAPRKATTAMPAKPDNAQAIALAAAQKQQALTSEQLASSVLENQHLQATIAEQQARLATQDQDIVAAKQTIVDLQTRLTEVQAPPASAAAPVAPAPVGSPPVAEAAEEAGESNFWLMTGLVLLLLLLIIAFWVRRQRSHTQVLPEPLPMPPVAPEPVVSRVEPLVAQVAGDETGQRVTAQEHVAPRKKTTPASDVLEGVRLYLAYGRLDEAAGILREALLKEPQRLDLGQRLLEVLGQQDAVAEYAKQESHLRESGVSEETLQDIRQRFAKLSTAAGLAPQVLAASVAAVPVSTALDEFQLNLDDLSTDSDWNLVSPFDTTPPARHTQTADTALDFDPLFNSNLNELPLVFEMSDEPFLSDLDEPEQACISETEALDQAFLDSFASPSPMLEIEPLSVDFDGLELEQSAAGKLQQAQGCLDDGDLDSASRLLNELLEEGDEPLQRTARNLLARMG
ncbi:hypothetical protein PS723_02977 [Pseudomonas fluorescens]|uniref:FimV N-terminal domain-containing protein n=1 Tax=Pseudomonas fluorescens TaxID=294 RepID=A0A5E7CLS8_PSEFL|nr:hypothetical protein PS723_02977 [Pseudomonas fluorescens]